MAVKMRKRNISITSNNMFKLCLRAIIKGQRLLQITSQLCDDVTGALIDNEASMTPITWAF